MTNVKNKYLLLLNEADNILLATQNVPAGTVIEIDSLPLTLGFSLALGHKVARRQIPAGAPVIKYGVPIGEATQPITPGAHVHVHNLRSTYTATHILEVAPHE